MSRVDGSRSGGGSPIFMSFAPMDRVRLHTPKTAKTAKATLALLHLGVIAYYCIGGFVFWGGFVCLVCLFCLFPHVH